MTTKRNAEELRKSGFENSEKPLEILRFPSESLGQSYPDHYPHPADALGAPLTIREVAELLGCSPWTVRHQHLPRGIPYFRSGPFGKLIFYRNQVIQWILQHQRKGGR